LFTRIPHTDRAYLSPGGLLRWLESKSSQLKFPNDELIRLAVLDPRTETPDYLDEIDVAASPIPLPPSAWPYAFVDAYADPLRTATPVGSARDAGALFDATRRGARIRLTNSAGGPPAAYRRRRDALKGTLAERVALPPASSGAIPAWGIYQALDLRDRPRPTAKPGRPAWLSGCTPSNSSPPTDRLSDTPRQAREEPNGPAGRANRTTRHSGRRGPASEQGCRTRRPAAGQATSVAPRAVQRPSRTRS
jgi:hypothetical protein